MDYLGPLLIKSHQSDGYQKRWVALFTCFSVRAAHLEVVADCSAESTVQAIERFVARRGVPSLLMTDNQPGFLKAAKVTSQPWKDAPIAKEFQIHFAKV